MDLRLPTLVRSGRGCIESLPDALTELGVQRPLLVAEARAVGTELLERSVELLRCPGLSPANFADIGPSPSWKDVGACVQAIRSGNRDCLVALGGGGVIDVCKVAARLGQSGRARSPASPAVPVVAVLTTPPSGAEFSPAILVATTLRDQPGAGPVLPETVMIDPDITLSPPRSELVACAYDGLVHALEAFAGRAASPFTDLLSLSAVHLIVRSLPAVAADREDVADGHALTLGCMYSSLALASAGSGVAHAVAHPLTQENGIPHALATALVAPAALDMTWSSAPWLHDRLAMALRGGGVETPSAAGYGVSIGGALRSLAGEVGLELGLERHGVRARDLDRLATLAKQTGTSLENVRCEVGHPSLARLYRTAWRDRCPDPVDR